MPPGFQGLGVVDEGMLEIENLKQFCIGTTHIDQTLWLAEAGQARAVGCHRSWLWMGTG